VQVQDRERHRGETWYVFCAGIEKKKKKKRIQRKQEEVNENWKQIKRRWIIAQDCV
jgi:hypothetical protein